MKSLICLLLLSGSVSAQFAFVNSKPGFADVRESGSPSAKAVSRLSNGSILYAIDDEMKNGWLPVDFETEGKNHSGYIAAADVVPISKLKPVLYSYSNEHKTILKNAEISIVITETAFDKAKAKLSFSKANQRYLEKINGKPYYGTDGEIPTRQYGFIDVAFGTNKVVIPTSALEGLYEPTLENTEAFYDSKNDILYISSLNSDGAGGYCVLWIIEKRKYKTRHLFSNF